MQACFPVFHREDSDQEIANSFISLLEIAYSDDSLISNADRQNAISCLQFIETKESLESETLPLFFDRQLLAAALLILNRTDLLPAVRAYAPVMMKNLLVKENVREGVEGDVLISSHDIPYQYMATWIASTDVFENVYRARFTDNGANLDFLGINTINNNINNNESYGNSSQQLQNYRISSLPPMLIVNCADLISECSLLSWPIQSPDLLSIICPKGTELCRMPNTQRILNAFCRLFATLPHRRLPHGRKGEFMKALGERISMIIRHIVTCLSAEYGYINGFLEKLDSVSQKMTRMTSTIVNNTNNNCTIANFSTVFTPFFSDEKEYKYLGRICADLSCNLDTLGYVISIAFSLSGPYLSFIFTEGVTLALSALIELSHKSLGILKTLKKCQQSCQNTQSSFILHSLQLYENFLKGTYNGFTSKISNNAMDVAIKIAFYITPTIVSNELVSTNAYASSTIPLIEHIRQFFVNIIVTMESACYERNLEHIEKVLELIGSQGIKALITTSNDGESWSVSNNKNTKKGVSSSPATATQGHKQPQQAYFYDVLHANELNRVCMIALMMALQIPSIVFATIACRLLVSHFANFIQRYADLVLNRTNPQLESISNALEFSSKMKIFSNQMCFPEPLLQTLYPFCKRNDFDSWLETSSTDVKHLNAFSSEAKRLTEEQCLTHDMFFSTYGDFRSAATVLFKLLGFLYPEESGAFFIRVLDESLRAPRRFQGEECKIEVEGSTSAHPNVIGSSHIVTQREDQYEPRTESGNVTQQEPTYARWEATDFVANALLSSACRSPLFLDGMQAGAELLMETVLHLENLKKENSKLSNENSEGNAVAGDATLAPCWINIWLQVCDAAIADSSETVFSNTAQSGITVLSGTVSLPPSSKKSTSALTDVSNFLITPPPLQQLSSEKSWEIGEVAVREFLHFASMTSRWIKNGRPTPIFKDLDLISARKRGYTALLVFCVKFLKKELVAQSIPSQNLARFISEALTSLLNNSWNRAEGGIVLQSERQYIYETLGVLANIMANSEDRRRTLNSIVAVDMNKLLVFTAELKEQHSHQQNLFVSIICGDTKQLVEKRDNLITATVTLMGVLRRCDVQDTYSQELAALIIPSLIDIAVAFHGLKASDFPPGFAEILDPLEDEQREQILKGGGSRRAPDYNNKVSSCRRSFNYLRVNVYNGIALITTLLDAKDYLVQIAALLQSISNVTTYCFKIFCGSCLLKIVNDCSHCRPVVILALETMATYFEQSEEEWRLNPHAGSTSSNNSQNTQVYTNTLTNKLTRQSQQLNNDVVHSKQMFFLSRDFANFLQAVAIEGKPLSAVKQALSQNKVISKVEGAYGKSPLPSQDLSNALLRYKACLPNPSFDILQDPELYSVCCRSFKAQFLCGYSLFETVHVGITLIRQMITLNQTDFSRETTGTMTNPPLHVQRGSLSGSIDELFALLLFGVMSNPHVDRPHTRETLCRHLVYLYIETAPSLHGALINRYPFIQIRDDQGQFRQTILVSVEASLNFLADLVAYRNNWRAKRDLLVNVIFQSFYMELPK